MSMPLAPCKDCNMRSVGCHANCDRFVQFKKEMKEFNQRISDSYRNEYRHYHGFKSSTEK